MAREKAQSSTSEKQRDGEQGMILDSPALGEPLRTREKNPPRYGAQHRQDALWEGGNEALPPLWWQYKEFSGAKVYQDDALAMASWNRPFPGVRLDSPGQLVPGCEWHISPLGRSYFVNHNTRITSWKIPTPARPPGSLMSECIVEGHTEVIQSLTCLGTGSCNIMSASNDGSIRQWTRDGEPVGTPWHSDGGAVCSMAMSPDETMVVSGSADGRLRLWNVKKGSMIDNPWEGHDDAVQCVSWSPDALEIASGSQDGTIRRWNPKNGRQIAPPVETGCGWVYAVRYSPRGDKFTTGGEDKVIRVWSRVGELLIEIKGHEYDVTSLCWSKDGAYIFSASLDYTIRKWQLIDGKELVVFRDHTSGVRFICLSPDEHHLVSASSDCSVRIWDLKTNQPVGNPLLHDDELRVLDISPDGKYIVSAGTDAKIYVWSMEAALKRQGHDHVVVQIGDDGNTKRDTKLKGRAARPRHILDASLVSKQQPNNRGLAKYGNYFWDTDTNNAPSHAAPLASPSSPLRRGNLFGFLRFSTRPTNAQQSIPLQPRRWNFSPFFVGGPIRTVDVAAGRKKNRIAISPPTAAELARAELAAATQCTSGNEAGSSTQPGQPQAVPGAQVSHGRPTETHGSTDGTGEVSYEVRCCGLFFSCGRPTSHQS